MSEARALTIGSSVATTGAIAVRRDPTDSDTARDFFAISGGVIEVSDNKLKVLVDIFERQVHVELAFDQVKKLD